MSSPKGSGGSSRGPKPPRVPSERPGPVGGKRDVNRRKRIRQLCDAGLSLFLERGVVAVTIDEIVKQAGMAKASFYRYFKDKEELVDTLLSTISDPLRAALEACHQNLASADGPEDMMQAYQTLGAGLAQLLFQQPTVVRLFLQESRGPGVGARRPIVALAADIDQQSVLLTEAGRRHGLWKEFDSRLSTLVVVGAAERMLLAVLRSEDVGSLPNVPREFARLIIEGLGNPVKISQAEEAAEEE